MKRYRSKFIEHKDWAITIFNEQEKCMLVFLNDRGTTRVVSYDDNMFYVESLLDTYLSVIEDFFKGWRNLELNDKDYEEIKPLLRGYYKHIERQCDLDLEALNEHTREVLGL